MAISIPWWGKRQKKLGRVGLAVGPEGLAMACIDASGALSYCHFHSQPDDSRQLLAAKVAECGWHHMPCSVVLHPAYYQLLLAEAPAVQAGEMASAVRWKIKDLLDIPLAEAAVDYFLLPPDAYRGRQSMLYAAAIRQTVLQSLVEPVIAAGLAVDTVEVAELALHNLVARLPLDRGATAVLQLYDTEGFVNLVEGGEIYLCRRIDLGLSRFREGADNSAFFEALLLEIQRSMDFYESQLGKGIVSTLYLSPQSAVTSQIGGYLSTQLGLNIAPLDLADLDWQLPADIDGRCVTAIGAALQPLATKASASKPAAGAASAAH